MQSLNGFPNYLRLVENKISQIVLIDFRVHKRASIAHGCPQKNL